MPFPVNSISCAFQAYEKGIALFRWPNVVDIWSTYLTKFIRRYGSKEGRLDSQKLERARDLFTQCLDGCPADLAKPFYLLWAKMEEDYGQPRRAMQIYDKATTHVKKEEMYEVRERGFAWLTLVCSCCEFEYAGS